MPKNPFIGAKETLDNANRHIDRFLIEAAAYLSDSKHIHIIDIESEPGNKIYKIRFSEPIPFRLNSAALDAVTNIRDVLDNAVYGSVLASGVAIRKLKKIKFPFGDTADQVKGEAMANVDLHPDIRSVLLDFKPEARIDNPLWTINYLANSKKHRWNLAPFPIASQNIQFKPTSHLTFMGPSTMTLNPEWDSGKNELTYLRICGRYEGTFDTRIACDISFDDPETIRNTSALHALRIFSQQAQQVLIAVEAKCRILGWIG